MYMNIYTTWMRVFFVFFYFLQFVRCDTIKCFHITMLMHINVMYGWNSELKRIKIGVKAVLVYGIRIYIGGPLKVFISVFYPYHFYACNFSDFWFKLTRETVIRGSGGTGGTSRLFCRLTVSLNSKFSMKTDPRIENLVDLLTYDILKASEEIGKHK